MAMAFISDEMWTPKELRVLSDVQELLNPKIELLEFGLWAVLHFAQSSGANIGVFGGMDDTVLHWAQRW